MKGNKVKSFRFMGGFPKDIYNGAVDVFVSLEDDPFEYWVEVVTPQVFSSEMEKNKVNFIEPTYPSIIVRELTPSVIREALEAYAVEKEDAYWLKLYHLPVEFTINDLNTILDRQKKKEVVEHQMCYNRKKDYFLLIQDYLSRIISLDEFQSKFLQMEEEDSENGTRIREDFQELEGLTLAKDLEIFSDLMNKISTLCLDYSKLGVGDGTLKRMSESEFYSLVNSHYLQLQDAFPFENLK
jgi:hypothetical protein